MDTKVRNIIFKSLVGSRAYGTDVAGSDYDYKGIYIATEKEVLTGNFPEQIQKSKDETYYEVSRFLQLLSVGNPTMIELLFSPDDCISVDSEIMDLIRLNKEKFLTTKLASSFSGYAYAQIRKAEGLDKKMNWEKDRIVRKTPRDFCYITDLTNEDVHKLTDILYDDQIREIGVIKLDHVADGYLMYSKKDCNSFYPIDSENSNSLKLSSIKKGVKPIGFLHFNKSEYMKHCADYKSYQTWLKERNTQRYVDINEHGQKIDGKNLLHCMRLIDMGLEIAQGKGCIVKRPNAEYLKSIRHGQVDLEELLKIAKNKLELINKAFKESNLPDKVDEDFLTELLYNIRTYKIL